MDNTGIGKIAKIVIGVLNTVNWELTVNNLR